VDTRYGAGYHVKDLNPEWTKPYATIGFVSGTIFSVCVSLPKLSLCMTYLRIFPSRGNKIFCYGAILYLIGWLISCSIVEIFACRPIYASWDPTAADAKCISLRKYYLASGILNSVSDFLVFLWPARSLWQIQLPLKQRLGLIAVFASGCIVCVAGIVRLWYIQVVFTSSDYNWDGAIVWVATTIEVNVGIICGCLHTVKPLLAVWLPHIFGSSSGSNARNSYHNKGSRSRITGNRAFPFQTLSSDALARNLQGPGKTAKNPFSTQSQVVDELTSVNPSEPPKKDYGNNATPQVEVWATGGGDDGVNAPAHGIQYTQRVTIDSRPQGKLDIEGQSASTSTKRGVNDSDSEEWIMNENGR
ncbi:hypothetical protein K432DRAFT_290959, partial [Lepidopterella palustris CBS 459.81]